MEPATAFVDEAGNLPDPRDRWVILAAIVAQHPHALQFIIPRARRKQKRSELKKLRGRETKWVNAPDGLRQRVLADLSQHAVSIFWLGVDKENNSIEDTPENYGLMAIELLRECQAYYPSLQVCFDRRFDNPAREAHLNEIVTQAIPLAATPKHLDSQKDRRIQLADFVAGAVFQRLMRRGNWMDLLEAQVVSGWTVKWKAVIQKAKR